MSKRIFARDFGIYPNRYKNSLHDINKMIDSIKSDDEDVVIEFEEGKYILSHEEAIKRVINISNTTSEKEDRPRNIGVLFENKRNITIEGNGAFFAINGEMIIIMCENSSNIKFRNIVMDYIRPTMSEFHVDKATMTTLECTINKDSYYRMENGKLVFVGDDFEEKKPYHTIIYDKENDRSYKSSYSPIKTALSVSEMGPYKVKFTSTPRTTTEKVYDGLVFEVRNTIKSAVGLFIHKSRDISFENVKCHYMHGLGIVGQLSKNLTFDGVVCAPRAETMRHAAAFSDMMHFSMCNGKITIKNSKFSGAGADCINIHGSYLIVKQKLSDKRILLEFPQPATYGIDAFKVGDDIEAIDALTHNLQWANKVKSVKVVDKTHLLVDLVTPFDGIKIGQAVENVSKTPEVDIIGNTFDNIPSCAVLVTTRRKVNIIRNTFNQIASGAINIASDTTKWYESGKVLDVTIEKNTFNKCGFDSGKAVITIAPKNWIPSNKTAIHKNIKIRDNTFILDKTSAIVAKCTSDIKLEGNRYEGDAGTKPLYKFALCDGITLDREDYTTGYSKMSCSLMDKKKEVTIL